jgi:hypothetical protein
MNNTTLPRDTGAGWEPIDHGFTCYIEGLRLTIVFVDDDPAREMDAPTVYTSAVLREELKHPHHGYADLSERKLTLEEAREWLTRNAHEAAFRVSFDWALSKTGKHDQRRGEQSGDGAINAVHA